MDTESFTPMAVVWCLAVICHCENLCWVKARVAGMRGANELAGLVVDLSALASSLFFYGSIFFMFYNFGALAGGIFLLVLFLAPSLWTILYFSVVGHNTGPAVWVACTAVQWPLIFFIGFSMLSSSAITSASTQDRAANRALKVSSGDTQNASDIRQIHSQNTEQTYQSPSTDNNVNESLAYTAEMQTYPRHAHQRRVLISNDKYFENLDNDPVLQDQLALAGRFLQSGMQAKWQASFSDGKSGQEVRDSLLSILCNAEAVSEYNGYNGKDADKRIQRRAIELRSLAEGLVELKEFRPPSGYAASAERNR
jgi:hypothetical protein